MSTALFELEDFTETAPPKFTPDMWGCGVHALFRDDDAHARDCWHSMCPSCGDPVASGFAMRLNHTGADYGLCTSLELRLAHIANDLRLGRAPAVRDLTVLDLGWRFGPDGSRIAGGYVAPAIGCGRVIFGRRVT